MITTPDALSSAAPAPPDSSGGTSRNGRWAEGLARIRAGARTEPGRLRITAVVLTGLMLLFGAATAWQINDRSAATDAVVENSQPLAADAAALQRALAAANTTAARGILTDGDASARAHEAEEVRDHYEESIRTAGELLRTAAAQTDGSAPAERRITLLSEELPVYTGLVEAARANDRQGYPIGGAYLRYADGHMQETLLPVALELYQTEQASYQNDLDQAQSWPWLALAAGGLALTALVLAQRREYLRTNRVFNRELLAATAAGTLLLSWLVVGHAAASSALNTADRDGARSLHVLNEIWTETVQARGDQHMIVVMRGSGEEFAESHEERMGEITGTYSSDGLLEQAEHLADDQETRERTESVADSVSAWQDTHERVMDSVENGDHAEAVRLVTGTANSPYAKPEERLDETLEEAVAHQQQRFDDAAGRAGGWFSGLTVGAAAVGLIGAGAAVLGIGRRLSEYR